MTETDQLRTRINLRVQNALGHRRRTVGRALLLAGVACASPAIAVVQVDFLVEEDTTVTNHTGIGGPNGNLNYDTNLYVIGEGGGNSRQYYSIPLLKFDLAGVNGTVSGQTRLNAFYSARLYPALTNDVSAREVLLPWDARTVTYNTFGLAAGVQLGTDISNTALDNNTLGSGTQTYYGWNVPTALVQSWTGNPTTANKGLAFVPADVNSTKDTYIASLEAGWQTAAYLRTNFTGDVGISAGATSTARGLTVDSTGRFVMFSSSNFQNLGHTQVDAGGTVILNGTFSTATANVLGNASVNFTGSSAEVTSTLAIGAGGHFDLGNGTLSAGQLDVGGDLTRLNWTGGTLRLTDSNLTLDASSPIGQTVTLAAGRTLEVVDNGPSGRTGLLNLGTNGVINLQGGTLNVGEIDSASISRLNWTSGTLGIFDSSVLIGTGGLFGANLDLGDRRIYVLNSYGSQAGAGQLTISDATTSNGANLTARSGGVTATTLTVGTAGGRGSLTVGSGGSGNLNTSGMIVGTGTSGPMRSIGVINVSNYGAVYNEYLEIGTSGGIGTATLSGQGSVLTYGAIQVGTGRAVVSGTDYGPGEGELSASGGRKIVASGPYTRVGYAGGLGTLNLTDPGTLWTTFQSSLMIGISRWTFGVERASVGSVNISNGAQLILGTVVAAELRIGETGGQGSLTVDGNLSKFDQFLPGNIYIGNQGAGLVGQTTGGVTVSNGGLFKTGGGFVKNVPNISTATIGSFGGIGTVNVSGTNSRWSHGGYVRLGENGTGTLKIGTGGLVEIAGPLTVFSSTAANVAQAGGFIEMSGGTLALQSIQASNIPSNVPRLTMTGGTLQATGSMTIPIFMAVGGAGGTLDSGLFSTFVPTSIVDVPGSPGGLTKTGLGDVSLGGTNTYTGPTTVKAGTLSMSSQAYQNVLTNSGGLDIQAGRASFAYGTGPSPLEQIRTILSAGYASNFTAAGLQIRSTTATPGRGLGYAVRNNTLTIAATYYGDATLDSVVDFNDFLALQNHFGQTNATFGDGDFDYNGVVDFNDFLVLQNNFGRFVPGVVAGAPLTAAQVASMTAFGRDYASVPEPAVLALAAWGVGLMRRYRRVPLAAA